MKKDFELFLKTVVENPKKISSLLEAVAKGDVGAAKPLAKGLGLSEDDFQAQGGGWIWIIVAGVAILYSTKAY